MLLLGLPRFGYEHLQPLFLVTILFLGMLSKKPGIIAYAFIFIFFCLNIISAIRHPYGNFFLSTEVQKAALKIKEIPGQTIYLLGAPDLIYPLSGKIPPYYTYVPSLPWYFGQKDFQDKIITSLENSKSPVLVSSEAQIDGKNIVTSSGNVFEYIKMNYTKGEMIGSFQLYLPNL